jgi:outer membrane lipoprotein-sorting protein
MNTRQHDPRSPRARAGQMTHLAAIAALALLPALAGGAAAAESPDAARVLDRYVEVTGGKAAHDAVRNCVTEMTLTLPGQEVSFDVTVYTARPNLMYTVVESPLTGKIENGVDGEVAWELSTMTGPRIKQGAERAAALRDATFDAMANWREVYAQAEIAGDDTVDDYACTKVLLTPKEGRPRTAYFDRDLGLLRRVDLTVDTPAGAIPTQMRMDDYGKAGELLVAHRSEITAMSQKRVMTVRSIRHNVELPADRFDPPAEVQKLLQPKP